MNVISERAWLIVFSVILIFIIVLIWFRMLQGYIEYNLAVSIVTSLGSTILTTIFVSLFLLLRDEREWRPVKKTIHDMITMQSALLFGELLRFVESEMDEIAFKYSILSVEDVKTRKAMIFSKLSELDKKEPSQLTLSHTVSQPDDVTLKLFLDVKRDIGDIQIRYGRHLTSGITERLMRIQDSLEAINQSHEMGLVMGKIQEQSPHDGFSEEVDA